MIIVYSSGYEKSAAALLFAVIFICTGGEGSGKSVKIIILEANGLTKSYGLKSFMKKKTGSSSMVEIRRLDGRPVNWRSMKKGIKAQFPDLKSYRLPVVRIQNMIMFKPSYEYIWASDTGSRKKRPYRDYQNQYQSRQAPLKIFSFF